MSTLAASGGLSVRLPEDHTLHILRFLSPEDVAKVARVAKSLNGPALRYWAELDLSRIFALRGRTVGILDQGVWETCIINRLKASKCTIDEVMFYKLAVALGGESLGEAPGTEEGRKAYIAEALAAADSALHAKVIEALDLSFKDDLPPSKQKQYMALKHIFASPIEGNQGAALVTVPKGLSLNRLHTLFPDRFWDVNEVVFREHGYVGVDQTCYVAITQGVFKGSRHKPVFKLLKSAEGKGYVLPNMMTVLSLLLLTAEKSERQRFSDTSWALIKCIEKVEGNSILVEDRSPSGLSVY